ncbi:HNH endonuclease [Bdellovibrio sp. qaytius]|nr:HNH endonuclease [Bdellovibrio sp. qaytius]
MMLKNLFLTGLLFFAVTANAYDSSIVKSSAYHELTLAQKETFKYTYYFVFTQSKEDSTEDHIYLADFKRVASEFPLPAVDYDRASQFGEWIRPIKSTCLNTRGVVLKRDSSVDITVNDKCTVTAGNWFDPYTNQTYNNADDIQIDHVVALKNAYMTGAHTWDKAKRCLYANYLGNKFHLLAVNGPENIRKSDKSPLEYIPPSKAFTCEYLRNWLEIKYIWDLKMTPREVTAIEEEITQNHCSTDDLTVSANEIKEQRQYMEVNKNLCQ